MNDIFIVCGPAGCGKSTWIEKHQDKKNSLVISRDNIRFGLMDDDCDYFKHENSVVKIFCEEINLLTKVFANKNIDIYIDATHLTPKVRARTFNQIQNKKDWHIHFVNFLTSEKLCLDQNAKRVGIKRVPDDVIKDMCVHFIPATYFEFEGFDISIIDEHLAPCYYFSADTHFNHNKDFIYGARGFNNIHEHDAQIIENWNSLVRQIDTVYFLGDFGMGTDCDYIAECVNRLNGNIYWIRGNHDTDKKVQYLKENCPNIISVTYADVFKYHKYSFYLSHYPTSVGNYDEINKFYCLCGHSHTHNKWQDFENMKSYHVELDAHNNYPVSINEIIEDLKNKSVIA